MENWYKESQVALSASIKVDHGTMRRARTTVGSSTNALDDVCCYLNDYKVRIQGSEGLVDTLNAIADGGITLEVDSNGYITANVNPKEYSEAEHEKAYNTEYQEKT